MIRHDYVRQLDRELRRLERTPDSPGYVLFGAVTLLFFVWLWSVGGAA